MSIKTKLAMYAAEKVSEHLLNRIKEAKERGSKVDLKELVNEHGLEAVESTIKVLKAHDEKSLQGMFRHDDLKRVDRFANRGGELYTQDELARNSSGHPSDHRQVNSGTELVDEVSSNPLLRESLTHAHKTGVLANAGSEVVAGQESQPLSEVSPNISGHLLQRARELMMGDGVVDSGELLSTIGLRNAPDVALGNATTASERARMKLMDEAMGVSLSID